jgi:hypothetical protein
MGYGIFLKIQNFFGAQKILVKVLKGFDDNGVKFAN